jgi:hypothetical protein
MLNVYREWHMQPEKTKGSWCSANSINGRAIRGIRETVNEVLNILTKEPGTKLKFELNFATTHFQVLQESTRSKQLLH